MTKDNDSEWNDSASEYDSAPAPDAEDADNTADTYYEPGLRRKFIGIDPNDASGLAGELEAAITRLTDDQSELARVKDLPYVKELYEELHPETKHGGIREGQVAGSATWPSFAVYAAQRSGFSQRSIYNRLETAERLATLDEKAERACYGNPIANQISLLVRIAQLPQVSVQRDVVNIYESAGPKKAKAELRRWEDELGVAKKPSKRSKRQSSEAAPAATDNTIAIPDVSTHEVARIIQALDVSAVEECLPAIEKLKASRSQPIESGTGTSAELKDIQERLDAAEATNRNLQEELKHYRAAPLGRLLRTLGAATVSQALENARALARLPESDGEEDPSPAVESPRVE